MKTAGRGSQKGHRKAAKTSPGRAIVAKRAKGTREKRRTPAKRPTVRSIKIRELDPVAKCGPGTSVQHLYRVDELLDGSPHWHLVFFDRHGWYCEHGRHCPAVADVRKHGKAHHLFTD
jgi:hypothetical protein